MRTSLLILLVVTLSTNKLVCGKRAKGKSGADVTQKPGSDINSVLVTKLRTHNVIPLSDANYSKYSSSPSQDYNAIIMFTAAGPQYGCDICARAAIYLSEVAGHYKNQIDFNTSTPKDRLVFFVADIDNNRGLFQKMKIEHVPRFYLFKLPTDGKKPVPVEIEGNRVSDGLSLIKTVNELIGIKVERKHFLQTSTVKFIEEIISSITFNSLQLSIKQRSCHRVIPYYCNSCLVFPIFPSIFSVTIFDSTTKSQSFLSVFASLKPHLPT